MNRAPFLVMRHPEEPDHRIMLRSVELLDGLKVPRGYVCNGTSVPRWLRPVFGEPFNGPNRNAGWGHDLLYTLAEWPRAKCDAWFERQLLADGKSKALARAMRYGVEIGAAAHYGKRDSFDAFIDEDLLQLWEARHLKQEIQPLVG